MIFLLDTNVLVHYLRESQVFEKIDREYQPLDASNIAVISAVTVGEIRSFALQNQWGTKRLSALEMLMSKLVIIDISAEDIFSRYAEIDAYSQNKLSHRPLPLTARNMGKNDLWKAATASVLGATLLTTDPDFEHLNGVFLPVAKISA